MTYAEYKKAGGSGFAGQPLYSFLGKKNINMNGFDALPMEEIVTGGFGYFQRALTGAMLLQPKNLTPQATEYIKTLVKAEYERHLACKHSINRYGLACTCGAYYNPALKASQIYSEATAKTWGVE